MYDPARGYPSAVPYVLYRDPHVLLVRGNARVETVDGVPDDYLEASRKLVGADAIAAFEYQVRARSTTRWRASC